MTQAVSAEALIATHQLHWVRHVPRIDKDRFPKIMQFPELKSGKRSQRGQRSSCPT